jgi:glycosyltransferase involved in cell wall biosynthesis
MRILQIHPFMKSESLSPAAGGMVRAALQLTRLLAESGHDVQVLPIPEGVGSRVMWEVSPDQPVEVDPSMDLPAYWDVKWLPGALLRLHPKSGSLREMYYDACALTALRRALLSFRPDIVHNHFARRPFPRLFRALGLPERTILTHHHGEAGDDLAAYDRVVFPSEATRDAILRESGYPREKTRRVYNPVHPAFLNGKAAAEKNRSDVYFVGAIRIRKGIDLLLDAWRRDPVLRKTMLHICGAGPDQRLVEEAIARDKLPVRLEGICPPEKLAGMLRTAGLVVIPSRMETLGVSILESLCCGVPVVGWAPTIRELTRVLGIPVGKPFDGRTQSAQMLADAVREAMVPGFRHGSYRLALAQAARRAFSEEKFRDGYLRVYEELA